MNIFNLVGEVGIPIDGLGHMLLPLPIARLHVQDRHDLAPLVVGHGLKRVALEDIERDVGLPSHVDAISLPARPDAVAELAHVCVAQRVVRDGRVGPWREVIDIHLQGPGVHIWPGRSDNAASQQEQTFTHKHCKVVPTTELLLGLVEYGKPTTRRRLHCYITIGGNDEFIDQDVHSVVLGGLNDLTRMHEAAHGVVIATGRGHRHSFSWGGHIRQVRKCLCARVFGQLCCRCCCLCIAPRTSLRLGLEPFRMVIRMHEGY
mmetsp:Transcript_95543/g.239428  ORF Transcript_95543/g.239428 Transcript_95543/m.239428 type:complete len:261 (+) Transcript_95543:411-1193(+)